MTEAPASRPPKPTRRPRPGRSKIAAVRVPKTGEIVADQIRRRIIRGDLREGEFLPSESELMESLGVSRPSLREAIRVLEAEQLVSVGRGSRTGARIHRPRFENVARYAGFALQAEETTIADIYSARLAIEPFVVARLAETDPAGAADGIDAEIDRLAQLVDAENHIDFISRVAEFHGVLVALSPFKTLLMITRMLQEIVARYQVRFIRARERTLAERHEIAMRALHSFHKLSKLIRSGDAAAAEEHWRTHLEVTNAIWLRDGAGDEIIDAFD